MGGRDLSMIVLKDIRVGALQNAGRAASEACGMVAQGCPSSTSLDSDQLDLLVLQELVKDTNGVGAAADTGDHCGWKLAFSFKNLRAGLAANHGMKIAHHGGIRMSAQNAAEQVMGVADIGDPITHGFVDGVLE